MANFLLNKLVDCAKAIEGGDLNHADSLLKKILTSDGSKATKALVKYFAEALVRRAYKLYPQNPRPFVPSCTDLRANIDYQFFPFFWFAVTAAHDPIANALMGKRQVHLIDISLVASVVRYDMLLPELAKHSTGPLSFQLTTIGPQLSNVFDYLQPQRQKLTERAKEFGVDFNWRQIFANTAADIVESVHKIQRTSEVEAVAVKWDFQLHKLLLLPDAIEQVLSKFKGLKPEIIIIIEQEASHNGPDVFDRLAQSFQYYSNLFLSLEEDTFQLDTYQDTNNYKVLWDMYFRRQISHVIAPKGINHAERHETLDYWEDRLLRGGFLPFRLWFERLGGPIFPNVSEYRTKEKNLCPVLHRNNFELAVASAWKPDPIYFNNGDPESMVAGVDIVQSASPWPLIEESQIAIDSSSTSHEDHEADADPIMIEGNIWSTECTSINKIAASAEIFDMLEHICHVHGLPLALTWISDSKDCNTHPDGKQILRIEHSACYLNDPTMKGFLEICAEGHLETGQGFAGKALLPKGMNILQDVSKFDIADYPFLHAAWKYGLHAAAAFRLTNTYMSGVDYVLEFFMPKKKRDILERFCLGGEIFSTLTDNCRKVWRVCDEDNIGSDSEGSTDQDQRMPNIAPAAISGNSSSELQSIYSLTSSQMRGLPAIWDQVDDGEDKEVEQPNPTFELSPYVGNKVVSMDSSQRTKGTNKRPRTSEVWNFFDEIRENGKVLARCKCCGKEYRGESTRGTTNLWKHLRTCLGQR